MRRMVLLCCAALVMGCARRDAEPAADTSAMSAPMLSLADLAGTWTVRTMSETSDSVLVEYQMTATADTTGWMIMLPNRPPQAVRVMVSGDSVMTEVGPFESVLRPGVQVTTRGVSRIVNGEMVGTMVARYAGAGADSVVTLRTRGTRNP